MTMPTDKPLHPQKYYRDLNPEANKNGYEYGGFCNGLHFWQRKERVFEPGKMTHDRYLVIELPEAHVCELAFYIKHGITYDPMTDGTLTNKERQAWRKARK